MTYDRIERAEPTVLIGTLASAIGFLVLNATDFSTMHAAAVAVGGSASQALLTRPFVYSPNSVAQLEHGKGVTAPELRQVGRQLPYPAEPTVTIGALTLLASFLAQMLAGVELTAALASSAGIVGVQTVATRSRVASPVTARRTAARYLRRVSAPGPQGPEAPVVAAA